MPEIKIDKDNIYYECNENFNSSKPTLLFVHGAGQSRLTWEYQSESFSRYSFCNFIIPDLPGHGKSNGNGFNSVEQYAQFTRQFIDSFGLQNLIIIGHSMGGAIAQLIALDNPDYLKAVVLVCTGAWMRVAKESINAAKNNYPAFCDVVPTRAFAEKSDEKLKVKFREGLLNTPQEIVYNDLKACDEFDITDRIINIKIPTLVIGAELDLLTPLKYIEYLHHQIHDSELVIIKESGHFVMQEKHAEFDSLITNYIESIF